MQMPISASSQLESVNSWKLQEHILRINMIGPAGFCDVLQKLLAVLHPTHELLYQSATCGSRCCGWPVWACNWGCKPSLGRFL